MNIRKKTKKRSSSFQAWAACFVPVQAKFRRRCGGISWKFQRRNGAKQAVPYFHFRPDGVPVQHPVCFFIFPENQKSWQRTAIHINNVRSPFLWKKRIETKNPIGTNAIISCMHSSFFITFSWSALFSMLQINCPVMLVWMLSPIVPLSWQKNRAYRFEFLYAQAYLKNAFRRMCFTVCGNDFINTF